MIINQNTYKNANMMAESNTPVGGTLHVNAEHSNLDYYYGPYKLEENQTVELFFADFTAETEGNITSTCFLPGFTLGIIPYGETDVTEYWYQGPETGWVKKLIESSGNPVAIVDHPYKGGWRIAPSSTITYPEIDGGLTDWITLSEGQWLLLYVQPGTEQGLGNSGRLYANNTYIGQICIKIKSSDVGTGKVLPTLFTDGNTGEIITVSEPIITTEDSVEYSTYWLTFLYTAPKDLIFSYRFRMNEASQDEIVNNHSVSNYLFPPGKNVKVGHAFWGNLTAGKTSFIDLSHRNKICYRNLTNTYRCVCIGRIINPSGLRSGVPGHMFINVLQNRGLWAAPQLYLFSWTQNYMAVGASNEYRLNGCLTKIGNSFNDRSTPSFSESINKISLYAVVGKVSSLEPSNFTKWAIDSGVIGEVTKKYWYWDLYCELEANSTALWKSLLVTSSSVDYIPLEELEGTQFELGKQEGVNATCYTNFDAVKTSKGLGQEIDWSVGNTNPSDLITPGNYYKFPLQTLVTKEELDYYGPYESVENARAATSAVLSDGLKVGVYAEEEIPAQLSGLSEEGVNYLLNASDSSLTDEEKALKYLNKFRLLWSSEENFNEIFLAYLGKQYDSTITYEYELYPGKTIDLLDVLYFDSTSETYYLDSIALREPITITFGSVSLNITGWYMSVSENFDATNHEFRTTTGTVENEIDCISTAKIEKNWPGSYLDPAPSKVGIIDYIWLNNNLILQSNLRIDTSGNYHLRINGFEKSDLTWRSCPWTLGYSQNGRNFPVNASSGKLYVSVPETVSNSWTLLNTDTCTVESSYQECSNDTIYGIFKNEKDNTTKSVALLQIDPDQFFVNGSEPVQLELNLGHTGDFTSTTPKYPIRDDGSGGIYAEGKRYTAGTGISISGWTVSTKLTHSDNTGKTGYIAYWTSDNNIKDLAFASYASKDLGSSFKYQDGEVTSDDTSHGIKISGSLKVTSGIQCDFLGVTDTGYFYDCEAQSLKIHKNIEVGNASSDASNGNVYATRFYEWSDKRLKTDIVDAEIHLDDIETIPVVNFEFKDSPNKIEIGTLAQDIKDLFPEVVTKKGNYYSVDYARLSVVAIAGVKLLKKELEDLKAKVLDLESKQNE